jgi:ActR/RegA family two-component response regulator
MTFDEYRKHEARARWEFLWGCLAAHGHNQTEAAKTLGLNRVHFRRMLGLDPDARPKHYTDDMMGRAPDE